MSHSGPAGPIGPYGDITTVHIAWEMDVEEVVEGGTKGVHITIEGEKRLQPTASQALSILSQWKLDCNHVTAIWQKYPREEP